jgi:hypothetical protein
MITTSVMRRREREDHLEHSFLRVLADLSLGQRTDANINTDPSYGPETEKRVRDREGDEEERWGGRDLLPFMSSISL